MCAELWIDYMRVERLVGGGVHGAGAMCVFVVPRLCGFGAHKSFGARCSYERAMRSLTDTGAFVGAVPLALD